FFSSRRRHTRFSRDWSSDVCSSDLKNVKEKTAQSSSKNPVIAPTSLLIYSVQVLAALNSSCTSILSSCLIRSASSLLPMRSSKLANRSFFSFLPAMYFSSYPSGSCDASVGGTSLSKHFGQSGHPIPDPVLRTTPPARINTNNETIVSMLMRKKRFSAGGSIFYR